MKLTGITVAAWIENSGGKLLMLNHKRHDDTWNLPGGKVDIGETPRAALLREVKEELGVDLEIVGLIGFREKYWHEDKMHWVDLIYRCNIRGGQQVRLVERDKHSAMKWGAKKDLIGEPKLIVQV